MNLVALDFDGVICDSARECLFSSYMAYARARGKPEPRGVESIPEPHQQQFLALRPFIRDGKDYLLIQHFIETGTSIGGQEDFDAESAARVAEVCELAGVESSAALEDLFQTTRRELRAADESAWLALNPLYPEMVTALNACREHGDRIFVTTSKPTDAALKILEYHQVPLAQAQIYGKDRVQKANGKNGHFKAVCELTGAALSQIHFVDDQVSHLQYAIEAGVPSYLATWGYNTAAQAEMAAQSGAVLLSGEDLASWMKSTLEA